MFALSSGSKFYTGRAGEAWVSSDKAEAFTYSETEAKRKADMFNRNSALHGLVFEVVAL